MFLKSITINNYKSIQKATVSFENGLNILIGKNGAGKSNLLQFIDQFVSYHSIVTPAKFSKISNLEYQFTISYKQDNLLNELIVYSKRDRNILNGEIEYSNEIKLSKKINEEYQYENKSIAIEEYVKMDILKSFHSASVSFKIPDDPHWLDKPNRFEIDIVMYPNSVSEYYNGLDIIVDLNYTIEVEILNQDTLKFENAELDNIKEFFFNKFNDFNEKYQLNYYLSKFSPIQEIRINPNINVYKVENKILVENLLIDFKVNNSWMPWSYLSDGSKRLFYLITQCLSLKDGLLLIEEPELGIHPHQLYSLMEFLKEQSADKQIIISTHSPMVLDILKPDELGKITIAKIENGGSKFYKLTDGQEALAKEYMQDVADLSDYWVHSDLENNYTETND